MAMTRFILTAALVLTASESFAQSDDIHSRPARNGWTHYENGFQVELPDVFQTVFEDPKGKWWFLTRDSLEQTNSAHHIGIVIECYECDPESPEDDDVDLPTAWKSYKKWMKNLISNRDDSVLVSTIVSKKCEVMTKTPASSDTASFWYQKGIQRKGRVFSLIAQFDFRDKSYMDAMLPRIAASFH